MNIEIRKLTPDLAEEYARFFDTTAHNNTGHGDRCYCITFCCDNVYNSGGSHWYPTPAERRAHAIQRVQNGHIQGYLVYWDDKIVGWCNANTKADCQEVMNYMRSVADVPIEECCTGEKIKFIFCFVIAPKMQRMGVATQLLNYICQDAANNGFDYVEAYTFKEFTQDGFRGPLAIYEKCGFSKHAEHEDKAVVRKALR